MTKRLQVYQGDGIVVSFDPNVCIHSGVCIGGLPAVFDVAKNPWIEAGAAPPDAIVAAVAACPSGALKTVRAGAPAAVAAAAAVPAVALRVDVGVKPNGPLLVRGPVRVVRENGEVVEKESCSLCRCGGTGNAPFCDGTHNRIGFKSPS